MYNLFMVYKTALWHGDFDPHAFNNKYMYLSLCQ